MTWEYKTILIDATGWLGGKVDADEITQALNALGGQGWELVVGFDTNKHSGQSRHVVLILKRQK